MHGRRAALIMALALAAAVGDADARGLEGAAGLRPVANNVAVAAVTYKGRKALQLRDLVFEGAEDRMVLLPIANFRDGVIEADIAGRPQAGAPEGARGFIGIAFRVQADPGRYEAFYIRPTNGRAEDQLRRNHAVQYISMPDHPWHQLRERTPGLYESYADMVPGEWTKFRIEVRGDKARLYLNGQPQPVLIVNDLKLGAGASGGIALWVANATEGYFSNVTVRAR